MADAFAADKEPRHHGKLPLLRRLLRWQYDPIGHQSRLLAPFVRESPRLVTLVFDHEPLFAHDAKRVSNSAVAHSGA
jgi:hypothetical protein